jgi:2-phosphosulfolactate phosphatase
VTDPAHTQAGHRVRTEWGPTGAAAIAGGADVAVVVDVLSFTTTVTVAVERGIAVHPFGWRDERAAAYAEELGATLAVGRFEALERPGTVSLSPASLSGVAGVDRLVLPSPNGSTISAALAASGATVVAACLRNAPAVAAWLRPRLDAGAVVAVVPAGERWADDTLRPAAEDLWGAGAVLAGLEERGFSPESRLARAAYRAVAGDLPGELTACAGGQELIGKGFAEDVAVAAGHGLSEVVPVLVDGAYVAG